MAQSGERFGAGHVIDILLGHETEKVLARNHQRLASFGSGLAHKKDFWLSLIRQLVAGGFLAPDPAGHGGLAIAEKGHALGRGEVPFHYRVEVRSRALRGKMRSAQATDTEGVDASLLAALKALRLRLAKERQVPAYVVFSDRTLIDMAERRPGDLDEFAEVNGVGAAKLKEFGEVFLSAIVGHQSDGSG